MPRTLALVLFALFSSGLAACSSDRPAPPPASTEPVVAPLASATQADLARDIDEAERRGTWSDVKKKWKKQALTWKVTRREPLCRTADACNVSAFAVAQGASQGWMPRLVFAAGEFEKLAAACKGQEMCDVTIAARLERLELNADDPINVTLGDVRLESTAVKTARL